MLEVILYILIFILGIYFGSFFTLATYRIPKGENITYKHSYCPHCNNKLGMLELVPLFSYLFLGGKCKHCKEKISMRYFLIELLSGITFVLFAISLHIGVETIEIVKIAYLLLGILYFASLFIIAGIDKEQHMIVKSVLMYGSIISIGYMIYSYTLNPDNVYAYIIYLCMMIVLLFVETNLLKRTLKYSYVIQLLILLLYMFIFTGTAYTFLTIVLTILAIGIRNMLLIIGKKKRKGFDNMQTPVAFFLCVSNIIVLIVSNIIINYFIK